MQNIESENHDSENEVMVNEEQLSELSQMMQDRCGDDEEVKVYDLKQMIFEQAGDACMIPER